MAISRRSPGGRRGRPANPAALRTNIMLDPDLKRRTAIRALEEGISLHQVIEAALRAYLKRGAGGAR